MQLVCPFFSQGLEGYNLIKWRTDSLLTVRKAQTCRYFSQCFQLLKSWMKGCYFVYLLISAKERKVELCVYNFLCVFPHSLWLLFLWDLFMRSFSIYTWNCLSVALLLKGAPSSYTLHSELHLLCNPNFFEQTVKKRCCS